MFFKPRLVTEIALAGVLAGMAIGLAFLTFQLGGGTVYLIGAPLFLMPLFVRYFLALASALVVVVIADLVSGWIIYTWISVLAYGLAISLLSLGRMRPLRWAYLLLALFALCEISAIYFFLEWAVFDLALATADLIATAVQNAIIALIVLVLYAPSLVLKRALTI